MNKYDIGNREIKIRIWNKSVYTELLESTIISLNNTGWINITKETNGGMNLYTGFKDKQGKEIYEGDIVQMTYEFQDEQVNTLALVLFDDAQFYFNEIDENWIEDWDFCDAHRMKVVGNIFEHEHLLKK